MRKKLTGAWTRFVAWGAAAGLSLFSGCRGQVADDNPASRVAGLLTVLIVALAVDRVTRDYLAD